MNLLEQRRRNADAAFARRQEEKDRDQARRQHEQVEADRRRTERRARWAGRWQAATGWVRQHPMQLAQVVLVVAPGILAFTAMAAYGREIYGLLGLLLPGLTEVGMWVFSFARQQARKHGRPTFVLTAGLVATMAAAAAMAYAHGAETSVTHGLVMALVNVSGVLVHQALVHADRDKRSREDRRQRRFQRAADRKAHRVRKRALRNAPVEIAADGTASVTVPAGRLTERRWKGFGPRYNEEHSPAADVAQPVGEHRSPRCSPSVSREEHLRSEEQLDAAGEHLVEGVEAYLRETANTGEEHPGNGVPRPADLRWEHRGTPEEHPEVQGEEHRGTPEEQGTAERNTSAVWDWHDLVNQFKDAIDCGVVNAHSQRDIASVMRCSKSRAKTLKSMFTNGKL